MFLEICHYSQENICVGVSFSTLFKRDFNAGVFLGILQNFYEKLFRQKTFGGIYRSSLLKQKQCGMVSTKNGRSGHSTLFTHY